MEDQKIIALYWQRAEQAITETQKKYGAYCYAIAQGIMHSAEDSKEIVSDTWLAAWNAIPPQSPRILKAFLSRITRNLSLDYWYHSQAEKRGGGEIPLALDELSECIGTMTTVESEYDGKELEQAIDRFVKDLPGNQQQVFLRRYWYLDPIDKIAGDLGYSHSKVTSMLMRQRKKLKQYLDKEGLL